MAIELKFFKTDPGVDLPTFSTEGSACFDLACNNYGKSHYVGYNAQNAEFKRPLHEGGRIYINPGDRILVPTGLIADIPEGYSIRIHARSGLSYKKGLVLANQEAVIDSDYIHEIMLMMLNTSTNGYFINHLDRIAQGELIYKEHYDIGEIKEAPTQKTSRIGGLGSTGVTQIVKPDKPIEGTVKPVKEKAKAKEVENASSTPAG